MYRSLITAKEDTYASNANIIHILGVIQGQMKTANNISKIVIFEYHKHHLLSLGQDVN